MDRNTVVRIAIPLSLYESVKGKVLNEAKKPVDAAKKKADAKKAAEKKAADIKETKEPKEKKSSEDAELIAKMEKMAKGTDPGKAYAAELFLKTLKKKK
jgi:hypothetical protein